LDGGDEPSVEELRAAGAAIPQPVTAGGTIAAHAIQNVVAGGWTQNIFLKALQLAGPYADAYVSAFADRLIAYTEKLPAAPRS
jgi:hypothetical protein